MDSQTKQQTKPKLFLYILLGVLALIVLIILLGNNKGGKRTKLSDEKMDEIIQALNDRSRASVEFTPEQQAEVINALNKRSVQVEMTPQQMDEIIKQLQMKDGN